MKNGLVLITNTVYEALLKILAVVLFATFLLWLTNSRENYEELIPEYTTEDGNVTKREVR